MALQTKNKLGTNEGASTMLKEFSFRNCHSFLDNTVFSMEANHALKDNINFVRTCGENNNAVYLNPVAAIYGSNAGGKTSILRALRDAVTNVYIGLGFRNSRFFLTLSSEEAFTHRLVVIRDNMEYDYSYTATRSEVRQEAFVMRELTNSGATRKVFSRNGADIDTMFDDESTESKILTSTAANKGILVMKTVGEIQLQPFTPFYEWCGSVVSVTRVLGEKERQDALNGYALTLHQDKDRKKLQKFSQFINTFDSSIGFIETIIDGSDQEDNKDSSIEPNIRLAAGHTFTDPSGVRRGRYFPVEMESNGTSKVMELYPMLTGALEEGTPFVYDELDTSLHPLIFKKIVSLFNKKDSNPKGAQLIFTAHNTVVMNRECLRRDEIYYATKDEDGKSSILRLSDVVDEDGNKIRMDARYDKLYLDGLIGATPDMFRNATL